MTIVVVAAVIIDRGRVLVTQRPRGSHLAGLWEFPGGKVEDGEDPRAALQREMKEEIGVDADVGDVLDVTFHRYPEKDILLLFFHTFLHPASPPPRTVDVAAIAWRTCNELIDEEFPPADVAILDRVRAQLRQMS